MKTLLILLVVIGSFEKEENAIKLASKEKAEIQFNPDKKLYYVFVLKTEDHDKAFEEARRLQAESEFKDAWVFSDPPMESIKEDEIIFEAAPEDPLPVAENPKYQKNFFFHVMFESGSNVNGSEITIIEPKSQRKEYVVKGNENVTIKAVNQSGAMRLEVDLVGYRKIIQNIDFNHPDSIEGATIEPNRIIVPFTVIRLKKGDHSILYNVLFYKDAAIMRPESKIDLDGVLAMMNENPRYKIRIHGHTNGNAAGKILEAGESGDVFSMDGAKEGSGSAKKLSLKRAEAIRNYLVKRGVDPTRMTTKAWGGKKPIYDKLHTQAAANVRVEVEVLEE
jgi:outer membrane protein OmpA-like peptidoglycan-associated protein